jgi:hypothetical protein
MRKDQKRKKRSGWDEERIGKNRKGEDWEKRGRTEDRLGRRRTEEEKRKSIVSDII